MHKAGPPGSCSLGDPLVPNLAEDITAWYSVHLVSKGAALVMGGTGDLGTCPSQTCDHPTSPFPWGPVPGEEGWGWEVGAGGSVSFYLFIFFDVDYF